MKAADRTGAEARRALWLRRSAEAIVVMRSGSRWAEGRGRDASLKSYRRWSVELLGTSSIARGTNPVRTLLRRTPPSALRRAKGTTKNKAGIDGDMIGLWCVAATFNCCVFLHPQHTLQQRAAATRRCVWKAQLWHGMLDMPRYLTMLRNGPNNLTRICFAKPTLLQYRYRHLYGSRGRDCQRSGAP